MSSLPFQGTKTYINGETLQYVVTSLSDEEERPKIDEDIKKELLKKTKEGEGGTHDVSEIASKLEGKIPTKPKEED